MTLVAEAPVATFDADRLAATLAILTSYVDDLLEIAHWDLGHPIMDDDTLAVAISVF